MKKLMKLSTRCTINACSIDPRGPFLVLCTSDSEAPIKLYDFKGCMKSQFGSSVRGLAYARGICFDSLRSIYVISTENKLVRMENGGVELDSFQLGARPCGIAHNPQKDLYVVTDAPLHANHAIHIVSPNLKKAVLSFGSTGQGDSQFDNPCHVHVTNGSGADQPVIVVSDKNNHCVKVFDFAGRHLKTYGMYGQGNGELSNPKSVSIDWTGRVMVCDKDNSRVAAFWTENEADYWKCIVAKDQLKGLPINIVVDNMRGLLVVQMINSIQIYQIVGK